VSLAARRYDLAGRLLSSVLERADRSRNSAGPSLPSAPAKWAKDSVRRHTPPPAALIPETPHCVCWGHTATNRAPKTVPTSCELPFPRHGARRHRLVCGMNLHLLGGLRDRLPAADSPPSCGGRCLQLCTPITSPPTKTNFALVTSQHWQRSGVRVKSGCSGDQLTS
jgi:hypothetical protein